MSKHTNKSIERTILGMYKSLGRVPKAVEFKKEHSGEYNAIMSGQLGIKTYNKYVTKIGLEPPYPKLDPPSEEVPGIIKRTLERNNFSDLGGLEAATNRSRVGIQWYIEGPSAKIKIEKIKFRTGRRSHPLRYSIHDLFFDLTGKSFYYLPEKEKEAAKDLALYIFANLPNEITPGMKRSLGRGIKNGIKASKAMRQELNSSLEKLIQSYSRVKEIIKE